MLKSEDVAIPMSNDAIEKSMLNRANAGHFKRLVEKRATAPFSTEILDYLDELSKTLFKDSRTKQFPDVTTFAFYCRKGNLLKLKSEFTNNNEIRLGRGFTFHIAPSNVPVNFAYSLVTGLLAGNSNIVRVPTKNFEQIQIICDAIDQLYKSGLHRHVSDRVMLIRYDSEAESITRLLSSLCAVRMIWGGDQTIRTLRKYELAPRSFDIVFSDRYSLCVIQADSILKAKNLGSVVSGFYNDTYLFDQNACTSPQLVIWLGNEAEVASAREIFWQKLQNLVQIKYDHQAIFSIDKLVACCGQAIEMGDVRRLDGENNLLIRVQLNSIGKNIENYRCNSGYFSEYHCRSLNELTSIVTPRYQTLAYFGLEKNELTEFMSSERPTGIDRIVPIGKTSDFSLNWDGYNLIHSLSRVVDIV